MDLHGGPHWVSQPMRYYPVFLKLDGKAALVVGGGGVGKRKIRTLIDSGVASVTVVDACPPDDALREIVKHDAVDFHCRPFEEGDIDGKFLVMACTSNTEVNERISDLCHRRGVLCNVADQPEQCSFIVPASIRRGDLTLAVSTSGKSPAMAKRIRRELEETFGDEYARLLRLMGEIRPLMLALDMRTADNTAVFRALVNSSLLEQMRLHNLDGVEEILKESLPRPLHDHIPELLHGLV